MKVSLLSTPMRYFSAVAAAGTVSRAAMRLHVAGSAISRQITTLEDALGVALFERRQRGMQLTEAGLRLADHLQHTQELADQVLDEVRGAHAHQQRLVRIACTDGFAAGFLPGLLARFRAGHAGTELQVAVVSPDEAVRRLRHNEADLALVFRVTVPAGCSVRFERDAPLHALMRRNHPLAGLASVTVAQVAACPLLLNERGSTSRQLFEAACSLRGLQPEPAVVATSLAMLLPMVGDREVLMAGDLAAAQLVGTTELVAVPFAAGELPPRRMLLLCAATRRLSPRATACADAIGAAMQRRGGGDAPRATKAATRG